MRLWVLILSLGVHSSEERGWKKRPKKKNPSTRSTYEEKPQRPESWLSSCFNFNHYAFHRHDADGVKVGDRFVVDIDGRENPLHAKKDDGNDKYPGMKLFDRHIELFDGAFYCATFSHNSEGIQRRYVRHCAGLVGELLDQDGDGKIDNPDLEEKLKEYRAHMIIVERQNSDEGAGNENKWLDENGDSTHEYLKLWDGEPYHILSDDENNVWQSETTTVYKKNYGTEFWPNDILYRMHHNDWDRMLEKILYNLYMGGYQHLHSDLALTGSVLTTLRENGKDENNNPISDDTASIWHSERHSHSDPDTAMNDRWDEEEYYQTWAEPTTVYDGKCNEKCMNYKLLYYAHATHLGLFVGRCQNDPENGYVASEQVQKDWGFVCRSNTDTKEQQIQYIEDAFGAGLNQIVTTWLPIAKTPYGFYCPPPVEYRAEKEQCTNGKSPIQVVRHEMDDQGLYPDGYGAGQHIAFTDSQYQWYVNVLDSTFHVYGREQVGVEKMRYIGSVLSYLLDYDQDGVVDDAALGAKLKENHAHMIVFSLEDKYTDAGTNNYMTYENNLYSDQFSNDWGSKKQFFRGGYLMDHGNTKWDIYQDGNVNPAFGSSLGNAGWGSILNTDGVNGSDKKGEPWIEYDKIDPFNPGYPRIYQKEDWGNFAWDTTVEKAIMNIFYWGLSESDPDNFAYDNSDSTLRKIMDQWITDGKYNVADSEVCIEGITCGATLKSMKNQVEPPYTDCTACQAARFVAFAARQRMGLFGPLPGASKQEDFIRKSLDPKYAATMDWTCENSIDDNEKSPIYGYLDDLTLINHCTVKGQWMDDNSNDASPDELADDLNALIEKVKGFTFIPQRDYCVPDADTIPVETTLQNCHLIETNNFNKANGMVDRFVEHTINDDKLRHSFLQFFATKIELFNGAFTIFAEEGVSQENMHYAAHIANQFLDRDGNGSVYHKKLEEYLWAQIAHIAIFKSDSRQTTKKQYFEALKSSNYPMLAALQENEMEPRQPGLPGNDETIRMIFMNIQTLGWKYMDKTEEIDMRCDELDPANPLWKDAVEKAEAETSTSIWETDRGWYKSMPPSLPYTDCERVSDSVEKDHVICKAQQLLYLGWATKMGFFKSTSNAAGSWFNRRTPRIGGRCPYAWDIYRWEFCDYEEFKNHPDDICTQEMDQKDVDDDEPCSADRRYQFTYLRNLLEIDEPLWTHLPETFDIKPFKYNPACDTFSKAKPDLSALSFYESIEVFGWMNNVDPGVLSVQAVPPPRSRDTVCSYGHQLPAPTSEEEMNALRAMRHIGYGGPFDTAYQLEDHNTDFITNPEKYYGNVYHTIVSYVDRDNDGVPSVYDMNEKKSTKDFIKLNLASTYGLEEEHGAGRTTNAQTLVFNPFYLHEENLFPNDLDASNDYEYNNGNKTVAYPFTNCRRCQRICVQYKTKYYHDIQRAVLEPEAPVDPCASFDPDSTETDYDALCDGASGGNYKCKLPGTSLCFENKWYGGMCALEEKDVTDTIALCPDLITIGRRSVREAATPPPVPATFEAAKRACDNMGPGYKLPTPKSQEEADELYRLIYQYSEMAADKVRNDGDMHAQSYFEGGFFLGFQEIENDDGETSWIDVYTQEPVTFFDWGSKHGLADGKYYYDFGPDFTRPEDLETTPIYMAANPQFNGWAVRPGEMQTADNDCDVVPTQFKGDEPWCKACGESGEGCSNFCVEELITLPNPVNPEICPVVKDVGHDTQWHIYVWKQYFKRYTSILDGAFEVYGDSGVSDEDIIYVAKVAAHYLDSNGDGVVDNDVVAKNLRDHMAHIVIYSETINFNGYQMHLGPWESKDGLQAEFKDMKRWVSTLHVDDVNPLAPGDLGSDKTVDYVLQHIFMFGLYQNRDDYEITSQLMTDHSCIDGKNADDEGTDRDCIFDKYHPHMFTSKSAVPVIKRLMQFYSAVVRSYQGLFGDKCRAGLKLKIEESRQDYDHSQATDFSYLWGGCDITVIRFIDMLTPVAELTNMIECSGDWESKNGCLVISNTPMKAFTPANSECFPTWISPPGDDDDDDGSESDSCDAGLESTPEVQVLLRKPDPHFGWLCFYINRNINSKMKDYADKEIDVMQGYFKVYAQNAVTDEKMRYVAAVAATIIDGDTGRGTIDPNSNTAAYKHMKENTRAHILIVADDYEDSKIANYREFLYDFRSKTGYPDFDTKGKMVRVLKASEVDLDRNKLREHDRTLEYVLRNILIWAHTQVEKELYLNDHNSKIAKYNSEYGHSGQSLYDYAYQDPCTADNHSNISIECQRLELMVFCVGAFQEWYQSKENRIWVQNHDYDHPQTFKRRDDTRPRFNFGDRHYAHCRPMAGFLKEMKILTEHPLNSLQNSRNFLNECGTFRVQRAEEDVSDATTRAMTSSASAASECKYFEHRDNDPTWQNYNNPFLRIRNEKRTKEKSWYHPDNFDTNLPSNWNGRITLWDDTFVILFNQNEKVRARRIAKVVSSMLDPQGTGKINDSNLQKKLFQAQAHMLMGCKHGCDAKYDKQQYIAILKELKKCSGNDCDTWNSLYHMEVPSYYDNDLKQLEVFLRGVINGFVKSADAYTAASTPSFFNHMALTSMTVDDGCGEADCQETNLIGLTQMVIDGRFNNDADCKDAMVQFGWGDSDRLACTENDLTTLGHNDLLAAAKNGIKLGKPNENYCKQPQYEPVVWPGIECFEDRYPTNSFVGERRTRIFKLQEENYPNHCCGGVAPELGGDLAPQEYALSRCDCSYQDPAINMFKTTSEGGVGFDKYMRPADAIYIAADAAVPNEKLSKLASLVAQFFDSLHNQFENKKHIGWQTKGWFFSSATDPKDADYMNQQPHTQVIKSMIAHYAYIPVCDDSDPENVCPIKYLHNQFRPVPIKLSMFDPENFDDLSKDHSLRAIIFNFLGFVGFNNAGLTYSSYNAIWKKIADDTNNFYDKNQASKTIGDCIAQNKYIGEDDATKMCHILNIMYHTFMTWQGYYDGRYDLWKWGWKVQSKTELFRKDVLQGSEILTFALREIHCAPNWRSLKRHQVCVLSQYVPEEGPRKGENWAGPRVIDFASGYNCQPMGTSDVQDIQCMALGCPGSPFPTGMDNTDATSNYSPYTVMPLGDFGNGNQTQEAKCQGEFEQWSTCAATAEPAGTELCNPGDDTEDVVITVCHERCTCEPGYKYDSDNNCVSEYFCHMDPDKFAIWDLFDANDAWRDPVEVAQDESTMHTTATMLGANKKGKFSKCWDVYWNKDDERRIPFNNSQKMDRLPCHQAVRGPDSGESCVLDLYMYNQCTEPKENGRSSFLNKLSSTSNPEDNLKELLFNKGFMEKAITVMFDYKDKSGYFISDHKEGRTGYPVFHVLADKYVPDERMIHVAGVAAQILDKNMNMKPDSGSLARKLRDNFAHITIHSSIMMREKDGNPNIHPVYRYFDVKNFKDKTGIEGPFGWLRGGQVAVNANGEVVKNGSPVECLKSMSNDECGNDIFPEEWNDPNRDLTQREVMKAIIGYGLRYTDPGRFGGEDECDDNKRCKYNWRPNKNKYQSLLQNAYEHASNEESNSHPNFDHSKYENSYTPPTKLFSNKAVIENFPSKDGPKCSDWIYRCWDMPNTKYHKMLAYAMHGYLNEMEPSGDAKEVKYAPDSTTHLTEGQWKYSKDKQPRVDHMLRDLVHYQCRRHTKDDYEGKNCKKMCPDGLPVSSGSRRCKNYKVAKNNFLVRHNGLYEPTFCDKKQIAIEGGANKQQTNSVAMSYVPQSNNPNENIYTTAAIDTTSPYTWNAADFSVPIDDAAAGETNTTYAQSIIICDDPNTQLVDYYNSCKEYNTCEHQICITAEAPEWSLGCKCNEGWCRRTEDEFCFPCSECGKDGDSEDLVDDGIGFSGDYGPCYPDNGFYDELANKTIYTVFDTSRSDGDDDTVQSHCNPAFWTATIDDDDENVSNIDTKSYPCDELEAQAQQKMYEYGFDKYIKIFNSIYVFWNENEGKNLMTVKAFAHLVTSILDYGQVGRISNLKKENVGTKLGQPMRDAFAHIVICNNNNPITKDTNNGLDYACTNYHDDETGFAAWAKTQGQNAADETEKARWSKVENISPFNTVQMKDMNLKTGLSESDLGLAQAWRTIAWYAYFPAYVYADDNDAQSRFVQIQMGYNHHKGCGPIYGGEAGYWIPGPIKPEDKVKHDEATYDSITNICANPLNSTNPSDFSQECEDKSRGYSTCLKPGTGHCYTKKWSGHSCALTRDDVTADIELCDPCDNDDGDASTYDKTCDLATDGKMRCKNNVAENRCFSNKDGDGLKCALTDEESDDDHPICTAPCKHPRGMDGDYSETCDKATDGAMTCRKGEHLCFEEKWGGSRCSLTDAKVRDGVPLCPNTQSPCVDPGSGQNFYSASCDEATNGKLTCQGDYAQLRSVTPIDQLCFETVHSNWKDDSNYPGGVCTKNRTGIDLFADEDASGLYRKIPLCKPCLNEDGTDDYDEKCDRSTNGRMTCLKPGTNKCYAKTFGEFVEDKTSNLGYPTACSLSSNEMEKYKNKPYGKYPYCVHMSSCGEYYSLECDMASRGQMNCLYPETGNCYAATWTGDKCSIFGDDFEKCDKCGAQQSGKFTSYSADCDAASDGVYTCGESGSSICYKETGGSSACAMNSDDETDDIEACAAPCVGVDGKASSYSAECDAASNGKMTCLKEDTGRCFATGESFEWDGDKCALNEKWETNKIPFCENINPVCENSDGENLYDVRCWRADKSRGRTCLKPDTNHCYESADFSGKACSLTIADIGGPDSITLCDPCQLNDDGESSYAENCAMASGDEKTCKIGDSPWHCYKSVWDGVPHGPACSMFADDADDLHPICHVYQNTGPLTVDINTSCENICGRECDENTVGVSPNYYKPYAHLDPSNLKGESWPLKKDNCKGHCHLIRYMYYALLQNLDFEGNCEFDFSERNSLDYYRHYQLPVLSAFTGDVGGWNPARIGITYDACNFTSYSNENRTDVETVNGRPSCPDNEEFSDCANDCSDRPCPTLNSDNELVYDEKFCVTACIDKKCVCAEGYFRDPEDNACKLFDSCPAIANGKSVWPGLDCFKNNANYTRLFTLSTADVDHCTITGQASSEYDWTKRGNCEGFKDKQKQALIDAAWGSYMRPLDALYVLIANDTDTTDVSFIDNLAKLGSMIEQILDSTNEWRGADAAKRNRGFGLNKDVDASNRLPMADLVANFASLEAYIPICANGVCPANSEDWPESKTRWKPLPIDTTRFDPINYSDPQMDMTLKALLVNMFGFGGNAGVDSRHIDNIWYFISNNTDIYDMTTAAQNDADLATCIAANAGQWGSDRKCHAYFVIYHAYMTWNGFYEELSNPDYIASLGWKVTTQEELFQRDVLDLGATRLIYNPLRDWHCVMGWQSIAQYKGFHVCSMSQFQWTDSDGNDHVWAGPRKIDFISDGSSCEVLGPFPINDDDSDDGDNGDNDGDNDICIQPIGIPCEKQCDSETEFFNTCANSAYHDIDEYCDGADTDISTINMTQYDDQYTAASVCFKRCDCLPGYKRKITDWISGTTKCVKKYFCDGASEELTGDLNEFRLSLGLSGFDESTYTNDTAANDTVITVRSGDSDDENNEIDYRAAEKRSVKGMCLDETRSSCFSPYGRCENNPLNCLAMKDDVQETTAMKKWQLCHDFIEPHNNPRDNCKGTILENANSKIDFFPAMLLAKHTSVRFNLKFDGRTDDRWFKNGRYSHSNGGTLNNGFFNDKDGGDAVFHIFADKWVPDCYIKHVAGVAAQILDNDENGVADYPELVEKLRENFAHIVIMSAGVYSKLGDPNLKDHSNTQYKIAIEKYFDHEKFYDTMEIEGPFGYLRAPGFMNGTVMTCDTSFKERTKKFQKSSSNTGNLCIQDIYPAQSDNPSIDLTHREVMKAIIGFGLNYVQRSRYGSVKHCDKIDSDGDEEDCVGRKDRSLLENAYRIAIGEDDNTEGKKYKTYWPQEYFINNEKFLSDNKAKEAVKIKASRYQRMLAYLVMTLQNRAAAKGDDTQMQCCRQKYEDRDDEFAPEGTRDWNYENGNKKKSKVCDTSFEGRVRHCTTKGSKSKISNMDKRTYDLHTLDCRKKSVFVSNIGKYKVDGFKDCDDETGECAEHKRCKSDHGMIRGKRRLQKRHDGQYYVNPAYGYYSICDFFTQRKTTAGEGQTNAICNSWHDPKKCLINQKPETGEGRSSTSDEDEFEQECTDPNTHPVTCYFEQCMDSNCDIDEATATSCNATAPENIDCYEPGCACNDGYCRRDKYSPCFPCSECGRPERMADDLYGFSLMSVEGTDEMSVASRKASNGHECYPKNVWLPDVEPWGAEFISRFETARKNEGSGEIEGNSHCNPKYEALTRANALLNIDQKAYPCKTIEQKAQLKMSEYGFNKYIKVFNAIYVFWPSTIGNVKGPEIARLLSSVLDYAGIGRISDQEKNNLGTIVGNAMRERFAHIIICDNSNELNTACNAYHDETTGFKAWAAGKAVKRGLKTREGLEYSKMADVSPFNTIQAKHIDLTAIGGKDDLSLAQIWRSCMWYGWLPAWFDPSSWKSKYHLLTSGFDHHKQCGPLQTTDGSEKTTCSQYESAEVFENPPGCPPGTPCGNTWNLYKPYSIPEWSPPGELKGESWPLTNDCRGKCHLVRWLYYGLLHNKGYVMTEGNDEMDIKSPHYKKSYEWYVVAALAVITGNAEGFKYADFTPHYTKCKFTDGSEIFRLSTEEIRAYEFASEGKFNILPEQTPEDCDEDTEDFWSCANPCTEANCPDYGIDPITETESLVVKDNKVCVDVCQRQCICKNGLFRDPKTKKCITFSECLVQVEPASPCDDISLFECPQNSVCKGNSALKQGYTCECSEGYFMSGGNCKPKNPHGEKDTTDCNNYLTDKLEYTSTKSISRPRWYQTDENAVLIEVQTSRHKQKTFPLNWATYTAFLEFNYANCGTYFIKSFASGLIDVKIFDRGSQNPDPEQENLYSVRGKNAMWFQKSSGSKSLSRAVIQVTKNYPSRGHMTGNGDADLEHGQDDKCETCKMKETKWSQSTGGNKRDYFFLQLSGKNLNREKMGDRFDKCFDPRRIRIHIRFNDEPKDGTWSKNSLPFINLHDHRGFRIVREDATKCFLASKFKNYLDVDCEEKAVVNGETTRDGEFLGMLLKSDIKWCTDSGKRISKPGRRP